nr:DUF397 domain-containing protein [Murinocardiopsis flavida]
MGLPSDDLQWRTSSYTSISNCVEVADHGPGSFVRDSKNRNIGHLEFSRREWIAFLSSTARPTVDST